MEGYEEFFDKQPMPPLVGDKEKVKGRKKFSTKQTFNQTSCIISTNKSWKQFTQTKKGSQTNS